LLDHAETVEHGIEQIVEHNEILTQMFIGMQGMQMQDGKAAKISGFKPINEGRADSVVNVEIKKIFVTDHNVTVYYDFIVKDDGERKFYKVRISYFPDREKKQFELEANLPDCDLSFPIEMDMSSFDPLIWYAYGALANCTKPKTAKTGGTR
jgi:hypothetical protein